MVRIASILRPVTRSALSLEPKRRRALPAVTFHYWPPNRSLFPTPRSRSSLAAWTHPHANHDAAVEEYDIVIVGGGVIGSVLADQIVRCSAPHALRVALVEAGPGPRPGTEPTIPHPRSYAVSPASMQLVFGGKTPDERYFPQHNHGFYTSLQVWEAQQPASLVWTTQDLATNDDAYLGWCLEDHLLQEYVWKERLSVACAADRLKLYPSTELTDMQWPAAATAAGWVHGTLASRDDDVSRHRPIRTRLVIAADGNRSSIRASAGIAMHTYDYQQTAITFTVEYDPDGPSHWRHRAFQRFLGHGGPMALLPTRSAQHGVVVWSALPDEAQYWMERWKATGADATVARSDLVEHLNSVLQTGPERLPPLFPYDPYSSGSILSQAFQGIEHVLDTVQYGFAMAGQQQANRSFVAPPRIAQIASPLYAFPLTCQVTEQSQYTRGTHLALVGDAAHVVHPMAGQGLNLGLLDVQALTVCLEKALRSGMDVGTFLHEYNTSRQVQVSATVAGIHGLQGLFSKASQSPISKHIKSLGMNGIQNLPWIRQKIAQAACYGVV
jgi:ubiquinone biosynthesis monooxygenase Coq6